MIEAVLNRTVAWSLLSKGVLGLGLVMTWSGCGRTNETVERPDPIARELAAGTSWDETDRRRLDEALRDGRWDEALTPLRERLQNDVPIEPETAAWALAIGYVLGRPGDWVTRLVDEESDPWWRRLPAGSVWRRRDAERIRAGAELLLLDGRADLAGVWLNDPQSDRQPILLDLSAVAALERGDPDAAQRAWDASIAADPHRATPWLLRARWARRQGDVVKSAEDFEAARKRRPDEPILLREYAAFERTRGRSQHAAALLAQAERAAASRMIRGGMGAVEDRPERPRSVLPIEKEAPPPFTLDDLLTRLNQEAGTRAHGPGTRGSGSATDRSIGMNVGPGASP